MTELLKKEPLSVSLFINEVKALLDAGFSGELMVQGEISSFKSYPSGHWYFDIKDNDAQLRCTMFKGSNQHISAPPKNGDLVILTGRPDIYKARGQFQFIASSLSLSGEGNIHLEFERTKKRLQEEGLFDQDHKKPIPSLITRLFIITSSQGAAMHDIQKVLKRRMPMMELFIAHSLVQGDRAAESLKEKLEMANEMGGFDAVLITRGGGSAEDLHCFNDEALARAIYASKLPVVSAVGHEVDFTICDFVADYRAPTPSAAAEELSIDSDEILTDLQVYRDRIQQSVIRSINSNRQFVDDFWSRLVKTDLLISSHSRIRELLQGLRYGLRAAMSSKREVLNNIGVKLDQHNPVLKYKRYSDDLVKYKAILRPSLDRRLAVLHNEIRILQQRALNAHSREIGQTSLGLEASQMKLHSMMQRRKEQSSAALETRQSQLMNAIKSFRERKENIYKQYQARLKSLDPKLVLKRGYSLVSLQTSSSDLLAATGAEIKETEIIRDATRLKKGDLLNISFAKGSSIAAVEKINK